ncbi:MAG TPA: hypothetical protein VGK75_03705 [Casimicrobiaceae bacterium]|jgi:hypothetical protein
MNSYQTSTPRVTLVIAALALTALTIGVSVVVPATMDSGSRELGLLAARESVAPMPIPVFIEPASIEVVAAREPAFIRVHVRSVQPKHKQQS